MEMLDTVGAEHEIRVSVGTIPMQPPHLYLPYLPIPLE